MEGVRETEVDLGRTIEQHSSGANRTTGARHMKSIFETLAALGTGALLVAGCASSQTPVTSAEVPAAADAKPAEAAPAAPAAAPAAAAEAPAPAVAAAVAAPAPVASTAPSAAPAAATKAPTKGAAKKSAKKSGAAGSCGDGTCG
jgi:hypothetical protein